MSSPACVNYLGQDGEHALALVPFGSIGRSDLQTLAGASELTAAEIVKK